MLAIPAFFSQAARYDDVSAPFGNILRSGSMN